MTGGPRHLLHVFATFCAAGPQVRTALLMRAFGPGFRHTVVACDGRTEAKDLAEGVDLRLRSFEPAPGPMGAVRFARRLLDEEQPDLLLTYNWGAMDTVLAARTARFRRHVHHEDGFNVDEAEKLKGRRNWTRRVSLFGRDLIVPSSKLEAIARRTWRLSRVHMIPNGIDATRFAHDPAAGAAFRSAHGVPGDAFVIGAVGHLRPVKNFGRLIRAAAGAPWPEGCRPHLMIVGAGPEEPALRAEAAHHQGLGVTFTGHLEDLRPVYSAMDAFALSSDSEQQPVSLLEAMAAGRPVAATDVGDIASTLPPEARVNAVPLGPAVEPNLGRALASLAEDPARASALGSAGLARVAEDFSLDAMVERYRTVYEGAMAR